MMKFWRKRRPERGAVAVVVALSMVALMAAAAVGVDVARLVYERQQLQNSLDAAAAAGVMELPDNPAKAVLKAQKFASDNMVAANLGSIVPKIALRCVTSYNTTTKSPDWPTVKAVCGITSTAFNKLDCDESAGVCSVTCTTANKCNTIVVKYDKQVDFTFGPAIGIPTGSTGSIVSAACRGYCGTVKPNPMDVVVMADRTPSMNDTQLAAMKSGIQDMLGAMNQEQQYVAFGALGISAKNASATTGKAKMVATTSTSTEGFTDADYASFNSKGVTTWSSQNKKWHFNGTWIPIKYTNKYQKTVSGITQLDTTTELGSAVTGLDQSSHPGRYPVPWHMNSSANTIATSKYNQKSEDQYGQQIANYGNTHLASALKAAVRYSLYTDPQADLGLPDRSKYGTVQKVVIFETDGSPVEVFNSHSDALNLTNDLDVGATGSTPPVNGVQQKACDNFLAIADAARKTNKVKLIMIGVGAANTSACGSKTVPQTLSAAASPRSDGTRGKGLDCSIGNNAAIENSDGDNYFCAASSDELKSVFLAAFGSLNEKSTLMRLPNAGAFTDYS